MWETLKEITQNVFDFLYKLLLTLFDFFKDFLWWVIDNLMGAAALLLETTTSGFQALNPLQYISAIPPDVQGMLYLVGFNDCMSIIVTALLIRFTLQLIPFVRLGS